MKNNYRKLGDYIQPVDVRNSDKRCTEKELVGLSMTKEFRKSTSNIVGVDLSKYKIVSKKQFVCDFMSVIRVYKLPVVLNLSTDVIVSPAYTVFEVKDESKMLPEYLMIWMRRSEFDRFAFFKCDSAVRGGFNWEELCNTPVIVPDLKEQEKIVKTYNTITKRIQLKQKINEKLERVAQCLFEETIKQKEKNGKLKDIAEINSGKRPDDMTDGNIPLVGAGDVMGYISKFNYEGKTLVIGRVGTHGKVQRFNEKCWCSDNTLTIKSKLYEYTYFILKNIDYSLLNRGSTQPLITQTDIRDFDIFYLENDVKDFEKVASKLMHTYDENNLEIIKLQELKQLVISRISGR